jgi:hypothetical protein
MPLTQVSVITPKEIEAQLSDVIANWRAMADRLSEIRECGVIDPVALEELVGEWRKTVGGAYIFREALMYQFTQNFERLLDPFISLEEATPEESEESATVRYLTDQFARSEALFALLSSGKIVLSFGADRAQALPKDEARTFETSRSRLW